MSGPQVVIGIDMETDVGSWSSSYEGLRHGTPRLLELLNKHGVSCTFFFTGDGARRHPQVAGGVLAAGHEVGCHTLFHETIGDPLFDIPGMVPILPEEVEHRLAVATEWIDDATGVRPRSFRAPRLFGSTLMVNALERLGYAADASYPMYFYRERLTPYHPSATDWTQEGDLNILELPNFADLSMESHDPYGRDMDQWPLFRTESAEALMAHVDGYSRFCRDRGVTPFLCFYFHPWEFVPMPQGDIHSGEGSVRPDPFIVRNCGDYAVEQFDLLLTGLNERGATFHQACQVAEGARS